MTRSRDGANMSEWLAIQTMEKVDWVAVYQ